MLGRNLVRAELELSCQNLMVTWDSLKCFDSHLILLCKSCDLSMYADLFSVPPVHPPQIHFIPFSACSVYWIWKLDPLLAVFWMGFSPSEAPIGHWRMGGEKGEGSVSSQLLLGLCTASPAVVSFLHNDNSYRVASPPRISSLRALDCSFFFFLPFTFFFFTIFIGV